MKCDNLLINWIKSYRSGRPLLRMDEQAKKQKATRKTQLCPEN